MDPGQADASLGFPNDPVALTKGEGRVVGGTGFCTLRICSQRVGGTLTPPEESRAAHMQLTPSVVCCCPSEVENQRFVSLAFLRSVCCLLFSTRGRQAPNQHCLLTSPSLHFVFPSPRSQHSTASYCSVFLLQHREAIAQAVYIRIDRQKKEHAGTSTSTGSTSVQRMCFRLWLLLYQNFIPTLTMAGNFFLLFSGLANTALKMPRREKKGVGKISLCDGGL